MSFEDLAAIPGKGQISNLIHWVFVNMEGQTIAQTKADLFVVKYRDILEIFLLLDIFPPLAEL